MHRLAAPFAAVVLAAGIAAGGTLAASAGTPPPTPSYPTVTATPTVAPPTATPTPPVVNPFAGCRFTFTEAFTFNPGGRPRFVPRVLPAIICRGPGRSIRVFDLVR